MSEELNYESYDSSIVSLLISRHVAYYYYIDSL